MYNTYEEFMEYNTECLDDRMIEHYYEYEDREECSFENTEEWFENSFKKYYYEETDWFLFEIVRIGKEQFPFKKELMEEYDIKSRIKENDEEDNNYDNHEYKMEINRAFLHNYLSNVFTFEYFKDLLYENEIYNDVFADDEDDDDDEE